MLSLPAISSAIGEVTSKTNKNQNKTKPSITQIFKSLLFKFKLLVFTKMYLSCNSSIVQTPCLTTTQHNCE